MKMHAWMHELFFPFWYCSFFLKKECIYECIKLDFFCFIIFEECIYEYMWIFWIKIHAWMHEFFLLFDFVLFFLKNAFMHVWNFVNFLNENVCLNAWIFSFSWMIMHILKHEILFFISIFLNDNAWNSIFLYVQIFNNFTNDDFFQWTFQRHVSKRYVRILQKRRYVQKIFSLIFKCLKVYVQRNIF